MSLHRIRRIYKLNDQVIEGLSSVLIDCVEGGASVSFILPMTAKKAMDYWQSISEDIANNHRILLVAESSDGKIIGTTQVILNLPENQAHRADIAKMLVHRCARGQGLGIALLREAERFAKEEKRNVLVLDTVTGSPAEKMYLKEGWQVSGQIPNYAVMPDGKLCSTTYLYKIL